MNIHAAILKILQNLGKQDGIYSPPPMIDERVNLVLQLQFGLPSAANSENRFCGYNLVFCSLQLCETQTCVKCVSEEFHLKQKRIVALDKNVFEISKKVDSIVSDINCNSGQKNFIPVIYTESSNLNSDITDYNCFSNPNSAEASQRINESIKNYFVSNNANSNNELETKKIDEAFTLIAEREFENDTQRTVLTDENGTQTLINSYSVASRVLVSDLINMEKMENHFLIISASLGSQILKTYSLTKSNGEKDPELNVKDIAEFFFNIVAGKVQIKEMDGKPDFDELKKNFE